MLKLLAAGVTRVNVDGSTFEAMQNIAGSPVNEYPQLFSDGICNLYWKKNKTGVRKFLESRYTYDFKSLLKQDKFNAVMKDSMQNIITPPRQADCSFSDHFNFFW